MTDEQDPENPIIRSTSIYLYAQPSSLYDPPTAKVTAVGPAVVSAHNGVAEVVFSDGNRVTVEAMPRVVRPRRRGFFERLFGARTVWE